MQFTYPEILYFLFALIIPILIHLFHFQRFEKVYFTNLKLLKSIEQQTRKSSKLKQFLILLSRLFALACIILAFTMPYRTQKSNDIAQETVIYIDNSLSMQATKDGSALLDHIKTEVISNLPDNLSDLTLITNDQVIEHLDATTFKKEVLKIDYSTSNNHWKNIILTVDDVTRKTIFLISDFQAPYNEKPFILDTLHQYNVIKILPKPLKNIWVDSVSLGKNTLDHWQLNFLINSLNHTAKTPASLWINGELSGKTVIDFEKGNKINTSFKIPNQPKFSGYLEIEDSNLPFDNRLYFTHQPTKKKNVIIIGNNDPYLSKIYPSKEFNVVIENNPDFQYLDHKPPQLIILNKLNSFQDNFINNLKHYVLQGGHLVIIPPTEIEKDNYQRLFDQLDMGLLTGTVHQKELITKIAFEHPFFKGVFESETSNFAYPYTNQFYTTKLKNHSPLLELANGLPFVTELKLNKGRIFWFSSHIDSEQSNFQYSPLIVPLFYNFSLNLEEEQQLNYELNQIHTIKIDTTLTGENVMRLQHQNIDFIPIQRKSDQSIEFTTENFKGTPGIYQLVYQNDTIAQMAFNLSRQESVLNYVNFSAESDEHSNLNYYHSIKNGFTKWQALYKKQYLWQLFVIFALIFLGIEALLQKFLKN